MARAAPPSSIHGASPLADLRREVPDRISRGEMDPDLGGSLRSAGRPSAARRRRPVSGRGGGRGRRRRFRGPSRGSFADDRPETAAFGLGSYCSSAWGAPGPRSRSATRSLLTYGPGRCFENRPQRAPRRRPGTEMIYLDHAAGQRRCDARSRQRWRRSHARPTGTPRRATGGDGRQGPRSRMPRERVAGGARDRAAARPLRAGRDGVDQSRDSGPGGVDARIGARPPPAPAFHPGALGRPGGDGGGQSEGGAPSRTIEVSPTADLALPGGGAGALEEAALVSVQWVNQETGLRLPVETLAESCAEAGVPLHVDAIQAGGKLRIDMSAHPISALSLSGHKLGGPASTGLLVLAEGVELHPRVFGGGQESGLRPGTEDVAGAVGFALALDISARELERETTRLAALRERLETGLLGRLPQLRVHGAEGPRAPHILNVGVPGISPDLLHAALDGAGIAGSPGSACRSGAVAAKPGAPGALRRGGGPKRPPAGCRSGGPSKPEGDGPGGRDCVGGYRGTQRTMSRRILVAMSGGVDSSCSRRSPRGGGPRCHRRHDEDLLLPRDPRAYEDVFAGSTGSRTQGASRPTSGSPTTSSTSRRSSR